MDPTTWKRIESLFYEALDRDRESWSAFLLEACPDDETVRDEVTRLLEHHVREGTLFEGLLGANVSPADRDDVSGRVIGRYRIERELGWGGMGRVFLARRDDLPKRVALKVVREPLASPDRVRRFEQERRVLAALEHPHIAQLVDAGVTDDGTPFFAMEYVEGTSLTDHCVDGELSLDQRLRLFLDVCSAVRYAHTHLVVHRDLKPSNILVASDGRVKLLDFGVSKLLTHDVGDTTGAATRVFTPNYASPEQLSGRSVSTATDVYQLGALLYDLLTGEPPLLLSDLTPEEAEERLRRIDPRPPSTVAGAWVGPGQRDLDNVVLTALEKEPERRYTSVDALAADVQRFLDGLPVSARAATPAYRLRKFVLRNKVAAGFAALIVAYALTVSFTGIGIARARDRAEREAATSRRVTDYLVGVFASADPADTVPGQASARELVDRGAAQVDEELADEPEVRAAMQEALGRVYHGFGREDEAEALLTASLDTRRALFGDRSMEVADSRHALAQVLWAKGDLTAADSLGRRVLEVYRDLPEDDGRLWMTLNDLGTVHHQQGDLEGAEALLREVVAMTRRSHPEGHADLGGFSSNLANVLFSDGRYDEAQAMMVEALANDRRYLPADHPSIAIRLDNLGYMAYRAESYDVALEHAVEALAMYWRVYETPHPDMPYAMTTIAQASMALGDTARADSMFVAAIDLRLELGGPDNPDLFGSYRDFGLHLIRTGRAEEAIDRLEDALRLALASRGEDHEWVGTATFLLGRAQRELGHDDEALALLGRGVEIHVAALGPEHPVVTDEQAYVEAYRTSLGR